jgi:hypothetical protein
MANKENCERRRLAECGTVKIEMCDCGVVHLIVGCLTLRFDPLAYRELARTISESINHLSAAERPVLH